MPLDIFMQVLIFCFIQHLLLLPVIFLYCYWLSSYPPACALQLLLLWSLLLQNWWVELVQLNPLGFSTDLLPPISSDLTLPSLFPECRLQWASSHGMGPDFGHKVNHTASRQGLKPVSHLFCLIIRDKGYPEIVFSKALSKCTFLIYLNPLLLATLKTC